ncbi:MAG TPA: Hsp20/alpha crystallin family protein [Ktedonobacteraceae bacterium]|nr:Hsp20/alpha crystallin family protein [Ktedonobacteraceae bacterium]
MAHLVRYNPWGEVVSLREAMNRLFEDSVIPGNSIRGRQSGSNLYETPESFVLQISMPGVNPDDVEITVQQEALTISWKRSVSAPENARTHWAGFTSGKYQQQFALPSATNTEKAVASYENGVLTLTLPKAEYAKARTVKVTSQKPEPALA